MPSAALRNNDTDLQQDPGRILSQGWRLFRLLSATIALTAALLIFWGWSTYRSHRLNAATLERVTRLKELAGTIVHLDEVLTMSARMAAVTGEPEWEARYRQFEPALDAAINEAGALAPQAAQSATAQTDEANLKLVEMEHRAFDLVRSGRLAEAYAILFSSEYEAQKWVYKSGVETFLALMDRQVESDQARTRRQLLLFLGGLTLMFGVFLVAWAVVLRTTRRWQGLLVRNTQRLAEQARELSLMNQTLDRRVEERTQELVQRERVAQSLLEDLRTAKSQIEQQAATLQIANTKLRDLASLKDEFVAKVSHELRTPLTSIKEGLSLILDGALGETTADQQDFLKTMDGDLDRLTELINNMLDISKIEAGRMRLTRSRVEVRSLIDSLLRSYQSLLGHRTVRLEGGPVPPVFADAHRMLQVLTNLFSNAMKFTSDEGTIAFRLDGRDGMVAVTVRDNGPGISPEDLSKLFQKFSQVGGPSAGHPRGTGLGLVVCKELAELHGGSIQVESKVGAGTAFTVLLPVHSDAFALTESVRELRSLAEGEEGQEVAVIAVDAAQLLADGPAGQGRRERLEQLAVQIRQHLHRGDMVLTLDPSWVAVLAITDVRGIQAIVRRLRGSLQGAERLRFGAAIQEGVGSDPMALFQRASQSLDQGLAALSHG
jgi:signal transduction histidine kinase